MDSCATSRYVPLLINLTRGGVIHSSLSIVNHFCGNNFFPLKCTISPKTAAIMAMPLACCVCTALPHSQPRGSQLTTWMTSRSSLVVVSDAWVNRARAHFGWCGDLRSWAEEWSARIDLWIG